MIRAATVFPPPPSTRSPHARPSAGRNVGEPHFTYGQAFWLAYLSNTLVMIAVALLYRYADFITLLGGTEFNLGWIVGIGMVGSLTTRLALGSWLDRYGSKMLWLGSTLLFTVVCFAHLAITSHTGLAIYVLRILFCCALAGIYGASMTFISNGGPIERMAELVGMLGTAGFLGAVVGTMLGDYLFASPTLNQTHVAQMFIIAGLLGLASFPFAWLAVRAEVRPDHPPGLPLWKVIWRHHPGVVLLVGVAMGMGLGLPQTFLRTYAAELHISRIGLFFFIYAGSAIATRLLTRRWPERFGTRPLILLGMIAMVSSMAMFVLVHSEWHLVIPSLGFGFAHAILFPSVVAEGNVTFPDRHRGLATILVLAAWDIGQVIGAPTTGAVLRYSEAAGLPPYPTMFMTMATLLGLIGVWYAASIRRRGEGESGEWRGSK